MAGNCMGLFFWFIAILEHFDRALLTARRPDIEDITAHLLAVAIPTGTVVITNSSGSMVWPMAVGCVQF